MPENETKSSIGGREYTFQKLPAVKALQLETRLARIFGDALIRLLLSASTQPTNGTQATNEQLDQFAQRLQVFEKLKDDDILDIARMVFPYVMVNGRRIYLQNDADIDMAFTDYEGDLLQVLWEGVKHNLANFIKGLRLPSLPTTPTTA